VQTFTARKPFIDPAIFRDRNFVLGLCFIFVVGIILLASLALITPYLQNLMNYPVLTAGLVLAPRGIGTMVAMMIVGRIINRVDPRHLLASGQLLTAAVLGEMAYFTPEAWDDTRLKAAETMRAALAGPRPQNIITPRCSEGETHGGGLNGDFDQPLAFGTNG
jgi:DHA2 family multidrug resistance protein